MNIQTNENVFSLTRAGFNWPELTGATDFDAVLQPIYTAQDYAGIVGGKTYTPLSKTIGQAVTR